VEFPHPLPLTLGIMALIWGVMLPLMYRLAAKLTDDDKQEETA
jgi:hypothetical protein